jgi:hypothetical protein
MLLLATWLFAGLMASPALAAPPADEGRVLRIEGPDLFVALGRKDGMTLGLPLMVYRLVEVRDPDTGRTLRDSFLVGSVRVIEAGETLSRVRGEAALLLQIDVGDVVRPEQLVRSKSVSRPAVARGRAPSAAAGAPIIPPPSPDMKELAETFDKAAGQPVETRIAAWEAWLLRWPDSPHARAARAEIDTLRRARLALAAAKAESGHATPAVSEVPPPTSEETPASAPTPQPLGAAPRIPATLSGEASPPLFGTLQASAVTPRRVRPGQPVPVVLAMAHPEDVADATAFWRPADEEAWRPAPMAPYGDGALRVELPSETVDAAAIEVWVAATDTHGNESHAGGGPAHANRVAITRSRDAKDTQNNRDQVRLSVRSVRFGTATAEDTYTQLDLTLRHALTADDKAALVVGYGVWEGKTASNDTAANDTNLRFARAGAAIAVAKNFGVQFAGVFGVNQFGPQAGFEGKLRVGDVDRAALSLLVGGYRDFGQTVGLDLGWGTVPKFPMRAGVEVTSTPNTFDSTGVVLDYGVGWQPSQRLELGVNGGYALRSIQEAGPVLGGSMRWGW